VQGTHPPQQGVYPNPYPAAPMSRRHAPGWVMIAGVVLSVLLIAAGIGYVVVINAEGILTEMIAGTANKSEDLLWFSIGVPILSGVVSAGMFVIRRPASFVVSGIVGLLSLVVAVAQFTFGAPQSFYAVGAMTLAVAALVLILSFVGIIVSPRS
jgi:hypothetical protein